MKLTLVYIGFAFSHHLGTHGGYHHLEKYGEYDEAIDCQKFIEKCNTPIKNVFDRVKRYIIRRMTGVPFFPWYVAKMLWMGFTHRYCVFHIIYGENLYTPLLRFLPKTNKVVCTFHQPFSWFDNKRWRKNFAMIDAIMLVGEKEVHILKEVIGKDNVKYIPHGVYTDFYKPEYNVKKENLLLTVGNWLRDYNMADRIYTQFLELHPDWKIAVVTNQDNASHIHKDERIKCFFGISDGELKTLYLKSSVLFLPLIRYTANNSLLEAGACGCNILIASDFADNSYIPDDLITIVPMDEEKILSALETMEMNGYKESLAQFVKEHYSWNVIGKEVKGYLESLN